MSTRDIVVMDGNEAAAHVAHRLSEVAAIYPITPSSTMGELADEWSSKKQTNIWGAVPKIVEMQSEAGAIGTVHGALQAGSLATTFTASQGLLLMIPNMFKIAGELTSFVMHVAARAVATHALSIFGDHSDVMACRQTGFAMLASTSVQEAHDQAAIATACSLQSRVPFVHFFDGFRTSHELNRVELLTDDDLRTLIKQEWVDAHRARALTPDKPIIRGTAQNPDTFFQAREGCNPFYDRLPRIVKEEMERFGKLTGRTYLPYEYVGDPEAKNVVVIMGSGAETVSETVAYLNARGAKLGALIVRLYRPFAADMFVTALPHTTRRIAVLDRTKEPGATGEPLYQDVITALYQAHQAGALPTGEIPQIVGGRYGLSSKEFTPAMVKAIYDELEKPMPKSRFTVGIIDDVTKLSLDYDDKFDIEPESTVRALFFGLGADGTVGANKNSIKIIGDETDLFAQGYFVYDSKKSGGMTTSHLRFGKQRIKAPYLIRQANFIAVHQFQFLEKLDVLNDAAPNAVFLLNAPYPREQVWSKLPREIQQIIIDQHLKFYAIDANAVAKATGMGTRINTIMQTCFFAISGVLPREQAIDAIKKAIKKTYGKRGEEVIRRNFEAVDKTLENLHEITVPSKADSTIRQGTFDQPGMTEFVNRVTSVMMAGKGDLLPVSAFPVDGAWPTGTCKFEKRNIATEIPTWNPSICIQCNKCAFVCPHAAIRAKVYDVAALNGAPESFLSMPYKAPDLKGLSYTLQVAPEDCTGCNLCVQVCPAKDKSSAKTKAINMVPRLGVRDTERHNYEFFLNIPEIDRTRLARTDVKTSQFMLPLFEYSGACAGCGETPYVKLMTQLFGDRMVVANATGCSSIYGGNLPTTPYTTNRDGRGPAWANSLFEDNAEFGLGILLGLKEHREHAVRLVKQFSSHMGDGLLKGLLDPNQYGEKAIAEQRERVAELRRIISPIDDPKARLLDSLADYLVRKTVWIVGGDGWAYDIGYGGLDHLLSLPYDVRILVLDTEVYSNTGGQASKSTPLGAAAKFASSGKITQKKDLGLMAMSYRNAYVASIALGANDNHTVKAFMEAESYPGPAIIIAYSHCIAHGYDLKCGLDQQKLAVNCGVWPLYRYDPRLVDQGKPPLQIDSSTVRAPVADYMRNETRFAMVEKIDPVRFKELSEASVRNTAQRLALYKELSHISYPTEVMNGRPVPVEIEPVQNPQPRAQEGAGK
ncbi:MAG TPA: pyruvate:ferredoxin (flavodoxin) oxidoreductase [Phycisphaerae bacterium]|nr:pyruvate:ferredoxin (flavodoxin) oxidoreductase [Phycisphaerae bacterium]